MSTAPFLAPNRDDAYKEGRARTAGTNYYTVPGAPFVSPAGNGGIVANNIDHYYPFYVSAPLVVDQLAAEVSTAASGKNMRLGMYRADTSWQPIGAPLADSGDIDVSGTGVKTYTPGTAIYLPRGRYLNVQNNDDGTATLALRFWYTSPLGLSILPTTLGVNHVIRLYVARTYAAFPTPGTAWNTVGTGTGSGLQTHVVLRVTAV